MAELRLKYIYEYIGFVVTYFRLSYRTTRKINKIYTYIEYLHSLKAQISNAFIQVRLLEARLAQSL